jgi:hypothetical protein
MRREVHPVLGCLSDYPADSIGESVIVRRHDGRDPEIADLR